MNNADGASAHKPNQEIARILAQLRGEMRDYLKHVRSGFMRHRSSHGSPRAQPITGGRQAHRKAVEGLLDQLQVALADLGEDDAPVRVLRARVGIDRDHEAIEAAWLDVDIRLQAVSSRPALDAKRSAASAREAAGDAVSGAVGSRLGPAPERWTGRWITHRDAARVLGYTSTQSGAIASGDTLRKAIMAAPEGDPLALLRDKTVRRAKHPTNGRLRLRAVEWVARECEMHADDAGGALARLERRKARSGTP